MFKNLIHVCKILILKSPKNFFFMVVLLLVQAIVISSSVVSIIPLADFIIDSELSKPSAFTEKFINFFKYFAIGPSFFVFASFFAITQFWSQLLRHL